MTQVVLSLPESLSRDRPDCPLEEACQYACCDRGLLDCASRGMYYNEHDQADAVYYVPANTCAAVTGECVTGYQSFSGAVGAIMCACSDAVQMRALGTQRVWRVQLTSTVHRRSQVSRVSRVSDAPMGRFHSMHHSYEQDTPRFRVFGALECTRDCECDCCQNRCRHQPQSAASRPCWQV